MGVSLKKGQGVSLKKAENDLSMVTIGLGWDVKEKPKTGFLASLFGKDKKAEEEYDLDVVAFLCDQRGKISDLGEVVGGKNSLKGGDIVFFNSQKHKSGAIWLTGDNRTGAGDGDDEQIVARLNDLPDEYVKVVFVVQIYQGKAKGQSFQEVENAFIRAVDKTGKEMVRFDLSDGAGQVGCHSMLFAELSRERDSWKFHAIGEYMEADSFVSALRRYT
jgi:stress response protein SCP2